MSKFQKEYQKLKNREWSEKIKLWKLSGKSAQAWCLAERKSRQKNYVAPSGLQIWCELTQALQPGLCATGRNIN